MSLQLGVDDKDVLSYQTYPVVFESISFEKLKLKYVLKIILLLENKGSISLINCY